MLVGVECRGFASGRGEVQYVDPDASALWNVEALNELGECALARPRRAYDADHLSGQYIEADIVQDLLSVDAIAEADVVEGDVAADRRQPRAPHHIGLLRRGVEDVTKPQDRQARLVEVLPHLRETQHRRTDPACQNVEGDEFADRQAAVDHLLGTTIQEAG